MKAKKDENLVEKYKRIRDGRFDYDEKRRDDKEKEQCRKKSQ